MLLPFPSGPLLLEASGVRPTRLIGRESWVDGFSVMSHPVKLKTRNRMTVHPSLATDQQSGFHASAGSGDAGHHLGKLVIADLRPA